MGVGRNREPTVNVGQVTHQIGRQQDMIKHPFVAATVLLALPGCGLGGATGTPDALQSGGSQPTSLSSAPQTTLPPPLDYQVSLQTVLDAFDALDEPGPVTVTLRRTQRMSGSTELATSVETRTSDPNNPVVFITADYREMGASVESSLAAAAIAEEESDNFETFLPAAASAAAGWSIPVEFFIDAQPGESTMWLRIGDQIDFEKAQARTASVIYGQEFGDSVLESIVDIPELREKWFSRSYSNNLAFPGGLGLALTPAIGRQIMFNVGFREGRPPDNVSLQELSRDAVRVVLEVTDDPDYLPARIELDAEKRLIAIEYTERDGSSSRVEYDWEPELDVLALPAEKERATDGELQQLGAARGMSGVEAERKFKAVAEEIAG